MRMNKIGMVFLMVILILTACNVVGKDRSKENVDNSSVYSENRDDKAKIQKVNTDLEVEHGWHIVPEGIKKITISMEAENVETILFWIAPTGTETWGKELLLVTTLMVMMDGLLNGNLVIEYSTTILQFRL